MKLCNKSCWYGALVSRAGCGDTNGVPREPLSGKSRQQLSLQVRTRFERVVGDADPEEVRHVGAEACTISETLFKVRDELRTRHGRTFRTHVMGEGDENALNVHGLCGVRCQRPVEIEEVAALLTLKHRAHLGRKHLVDVERCKCYRDCLAAKAECERQPLELVLWTAFCDVGLHLDREQASGFRDARHLINAAQDPRGLRCISDGELQCHPDGRAFLPEN